MWHVVERWRSSTSTEKESISGAMLAELEVQRMIESAELWAFTVALAGLFGPFTIHTDSVGIIDELWRREEGGI